MIRTSRALGALFAAALSALASGQVVISQVNGDPGSGGSSDPYDRDFVELFNRGSTKCVGRRQHDAVSLLFEEIGELGG